VVQESLGRMLMMRVWDAHPTVLECHGCIVRFFYETVRSACGAVVCNGPWLANCALMLYELVLEVLNACAQDGGAEFRGPVFSRHQELLP